MNEGSARVINGREIAANLYQEMKKDVERLKERHILPGLAIIRVGNDYASGIYVNNKIKRSLEIGIHAKQYHIEETVSQAALIDKIETLNNDSKVHGIIIQLPLPRHIDPFSVIHAIHPAKDVDGFHPINVGKLTLGEPCLQPCTPQGCIVMLETVIKDFAGLHAVVIGRSNIVGRPMSTMLLAKNCTVTICHSYTKNLADITRTADIIIAAAGKPKFITKDMVKKGAVVLDVGINRINLGDDNYMMCGDVDFKEVSRVASYISPVPGGVGQLTVAMLIKNVIKAASMTRSFLDKVNR